MDPENAILVSLLIHVPAVVTWIAFAAVEAAVLVIPELANGHRARVMRALRWPTLFLILVIMVTGVWQTIDNPFQTVTSWETLEHLRETTTYGFALFVKHIFVVATFALSILIRFPLAGRLLQRSEADGAEATIGFIPLAVWLNVAACLATIVATTRMTVSLH